MSQKAQQETPRSSMGGIHIESYTRHLRTEPIDHRLTVAVECGGREVYTLTTEKVENTGCIPCLREYFQRVGTHPEEKAT